LRRPYITRWMIEAQRVAGIERKVNEFRRQQCHVTLIMKQCGEERKKVNVNVNVIQTKSLFIS